MQKLFPKISFFIYLFFAFFQVAFWSYTCYAACVGDIKKYLLNVIISLIILLAYLTTIILYGLTTFKYEANNTLLTITRILMIAIIVVVPFFDQNATLLMYIIYRPFIDTTAIRYLAYLLSESFFVLPTILSVIQLTKKLTLSR